MKVVGVCACTVGIAHTYIAQEKLEKAAEKAGIKVFLLPKYLVNRQNVDISSYPQGDFDDLLNYIDKLQKMD